MPDSPPVPESVPAPVPAPRPTDPTLAAVLCDDEFDSPARLLGGRPGPWAALGLFVLAAGADACLYPSFGGAGFAALAVLAGALLLGSAAGRPGGLALALGAALLLAAARAAWQMGTACAILLALCVLAFAIAARARGLRLPRVLLLAVPTLLVGGRRLLLFFRGLFAPIGESPSRLRALVVPVLLAGVFLLLFTLANPILEKAWRTAIEWIHVPWSRVLFWIASLWVFAALLRPVGPIPAPPGPDIPAAAKGLPLGFSDFASALGTLVVLNVLFLAFNALDAVYLWLHARLPLGVTYSEYAHRGVTWLTVALALSSLVLGLLFSGSLKDHPRRRTLEILAYLWAAQNLVLALGSFRRIQMYIECYGLTRLRIVGIAGTALVVVGLVFMVWMVNRKKGFGWLARADAAAFCVALVLLAVSPLDGLVARYNVDCVLKGQSRPLSFLVGQPITAESLPPIADLLAHPDPVISRGAEAFLARRLEALEREQALAAGWRAFQGSRACALSRLRALRERLFKRPYDERHADEKALLDLVRPWRD